MKIQSTAMPAMMPGMKKHMMGKEEMDEMKKKAPPPPKKKKK